MVTTVNVKMNLQIDLSEKSMSAYGTIRDSDTEAVKMQAVQDYLYGALNGWKSSNIAAFTALESGASFQLALEAVDGTDLPVWSELGAAVSGGLEAYNALGFGLELALADEGKPTTCIKYARKGNRIIIVHCHDLKVTKGVQDATQANILPIIASQPVPPVLQDFKNVGIEARYQMIVEVERIMPTK